MTTPADDRAPLTPRRPPAAPSQRATVTHIGERRAETGGPTATPRRPLPRLDGSLALRNDSRPGPPPTPELRLVDNEP